MSIIKKTFNCFSCGSYQFSRNKFTHFTDSVVVNASCKKNVFKFKVEAFKIDARVSKKDKKATERLEFFQVKNYFI